MVRIRDNEISIVGSWNYVGDELIADETCKRIEALISDYLLEIGYSKSGWRKYFLDPNDGRFWELSYPGSEMHAGGPPSLNEISKSELQERASSPGTADSEHVILGHQMEYPICNKV